MKQLLEGTRSNLFHIDPNDAVVIGIDTEHRSQAEHPRYDERVHTVHATLDENEILVAMSIGILTPVLAEVVDGKAVLIDGRGRTLLLREANRRLKKRGMPLKMLPVKAHKASATSAPMDDLVQIVTNEHRKEDTHEIRARKAQYLRERGTNIKDIAQVFKVSEATIDAWLKFNDLAPEIKAAVESGDLAPTSVTGLATLPEAEQRAILEVLPTKATKKEVDAIKRAKKKGAEAVVAPSRRVLGGIVKTGDEYLSEDFILGIRFALGDISPRAIPKLSGVINRLSAKPKKVSAKKEKPAPESEPEQTDTDSEEPNEEDDSDE